MSYIWSKQDFHIAMKEFHIINYKWQIRLNQFDTIIIKRFNFYNKSFKLLLHIL